MHKQTLTIPSGSPGTTSELSIWRYQQHRHGPKVYIQAALHADEWPGIFMLHHLHNMLEKARIYGEIIIIPFANPLGMRQFLGGYQLGRFDFDYSGNFNRGFFDLATHAVPYLDPQKLAQASTNEQISQVRQAFKQALNDWHPTLESEHLRKTLQTLSHDADYVLDVHCDAQACVHAFVNQRHQSLGEQLAKSLNASVLLLEEDPAGMAFDYANACPWWRLSKQLNLNLPNATFASTIELRGERDINAKYAHQDAQNLFNFLQIIGSIAPSPTTQYHDHISHPIGTPLSGVARIIAPHSGLLNFHIKAGEYVKQHDIIAELISIDDPNHPPTPLSAPTNGVVYALARNHLIRTGHVIAQIAGKEPLGDGQLAF